MGKHLIESTGLVEAFAKLSYGKLLVFGIHTLQLELIAKYPRGLGCSQASDIAALNADNY